MKKLFSVLLVLLMCSMAFFSAEADTILTVEDTIPFSASTDDAFEGGILIVCIKREYSFPNKVWEMSQFGNPEHVKDCIDLTASNDEKVINSDLSNENFRQILEVYLDTSDKSVTIEVAKQFGKSDFVYSVSVNYIYEPIVDDEYGFDFGSNDSISLMSTNADEFENNYFGITDDPYIGWQYSLFDIKVNRAWGVTKGSNEIIVGVIDTGVDPIPDLVDNLVAGYDMAEPDYHNTETSVVINDLPAVGDTEEFIDTATDKHGTKVASIIAASQNSIGITGIAPNVKIMPLRVTNDSGNIVAASYVRAFAMARVLQLPVVNFSINTDNSYVQGIRIGIDVRDYGWLAVLQNYQGIIVNSAGNDSSELEIGGNPVYPGTFKDDGLTNMIVVGSVDQDNNVTTFSNWGEDYVDLMAPGEGILTSYATNIVRDDTTGEITSITTGYEEVDGTSFSAPMVTATVALLLSVNSNLNVQQIKNAILANVNVIDELNGYCASSGILNVNDALLSIGPKMYNYCVSISTTEQISTSSEFTITFPINQLQLTDIYVDSYINNSFLYNVEVDLEVGEISMDFASITTFVGAGNIVLEVWFAAPADTITDKFMLANYGFSVDVGNNSLDYSYYLLGDGGGTGSLDSMISWIDFCMEYNSYMVAVDVNRDGVVNLADKERAYQYLNGEIKSLF